MDDEVDLDASMSSWLDSFVPDGQQERQPVDAQTHERVRNLQGIQITPVSADQNIQLDHNVLPDPNLVPNRPGHTLTFNQVGNAAQAQLAFNPLPGVSSRGIGSSRRASRGTSSTPLRTPGSPSGMEGSGRGAAPAHGDLRTPASPEVTWANFAPGPWRPRSPASR